MLHKFIHILIADDDQEDLELLEESFKKTNSGTQLSTVRNGREVIDFLSALQGQQLPSLIVLDYNMPELNGLEVLSIVCNDLRYNTIPIVIISTSDSPTHVRECKKSGAAGYFIKPNSMAELDKIAEKMIALCN